MAQHVPASPAGAAQLVPLAGKRPQHSQVPFGFRRARGAYKVAPEVPGGS
ncbi:hypothetical protein CSE45_1312 [Citreicella sp. SE45]|nr:hypothetical protein CSE45_1312 [Citreicella sp. SE45]